MNNSDSSNQTDMNNGGAEHVQNQDDKNVDELISEVESYLEYLGRILEHPQKSSALTKETKGEENITQQSFPML